MDTKDIVRRFYAEGLTVTPGQDPANVLGEILADSFESRNAKETKTKGMLTGQMQYLWKLIPDMKWEIQDILQDGNRVIVRSIFGGSPKGEFMGLSLDGSRKFSTMAIDIHTVENGKITTVYHVEEWATAIAQLKG